MLFFLQLKATSRIKSSVYFNSLSAKPVVLMEIDVRGIRLVKKPFFGWPIVGELAFIFSNT